MENNVDLTKDNVTKLFLKYLIPSIASTLVLSLCILFDTIFIARGVGSEGLAALNIAIPLFSILIGTGLLFGIGGAAAFSISMGQKRQEQAKVFFTHSVIMACVVGLLFSIIGLLFSERISYLLGATSENIGLVNGYVGILLPFGFFFLVNQTVAVFVRNDQAPKLAMWSMIIGNVINIVLDALFIFHFQWGMKGAAIATGIANAVSLLILCIHFFSKENRLVFIRVMPHYKTVRRIIGNGFSSFILELSFGIVIFAFNTVLLSIKGTLAVSAYSIIANVSIIFIAIFIGVSQAMQPIVSVNYGARKKERVQEVLRFAIYISLGLSLFFFGVGMLFPHWIVSLFTPDSQELIDITVQGIYIYFTGFLFTGINIIMAAYFQAIEYRMYATILTMSRGVIFILLGLIIFPNLFGILGVWMTGPLAELLTFGCMLFLAVRVKQQVKKRSIE
ncbi:MATE efflux family protein [Alkaliphilus metalliredigens QYMF]|uniref:Multidrug export protein MepA n=1 Tax=Alkaliphilus metalliredigens (strain QYMF) TaxID=293826 RepID=A6TVW6_ALKMQ|nr:MATE family efflux transporter [Alkaliphilus metalliredigens]ABR50334.1 MATE efflux family protein [Alkaliphilus metalliredigens QYMF]